MNEGDKVNEAFALGKKPSQVNAARNAEIARRVQIVEEERAIAEKRLSKISEKRPNTRSPEKVRNP
jgi:hypothetical protein